MKVLKGKILVQVKEKEKEHKTSSGLVVATLKIKDTDRFLDHGEGSVLQIGEGVSQVNVGDYIIWQRYAETKVAGSRAVVDEKAVFAILNNEVTNSGY